jgi:hypothetical protein
MLIFTMSDVYFQKDHLYSLTESLFNRIRQWKSVARQIKSTNCLKNNPSWISNNLTFAEESQVRLEFEFVKKLPLNVVVWHGIFDCFPDLRWRRRRDRTGANHAIIPIPVPVKKENKLIKVALKPYNSCSTKVPISRYRYTVPLYHIGCS